jgi:hypothetical protein
MLNGGRADALQIRRYRRVKVGVIGKPQRGNLCEFAWCDFEREAHEAAAEIRDQSRRIK